MLRIIIINIVFRYFSKASQTGWRMFKRRLQLKMVITAILVVIYFCKYLVILQYKINLKEHSIKVILGDGIKGVSRNDGSAGNCAGRFAGA